MLQRLHALIAAALFLVLNPKHFAFGLQLHRATSRTRLLLSPDEPHTGGLSSSIPTSIVTETTGGLRAWAVSAVTSISTVIALTAGGNRAAFAVENSSSSSSDSSGDNPIYVDKEEGFAIIIPPSWQTGYARKQPSSSTLGKYQPEEVIFSSLTIAEGASLSVTRSAARRLLKDFDVEWWFAPLESMNDLGSAELIAELLILQRQGEFIKRETPSKITDAKIDSNGVLRFDFLTPLAEEVYRRTQAKAFLRNNQLVVVWISGLQNVWDSDYGETLNKMRESFVLL